MRLEKRRSLYNLQPRLSFNCEDHANHILNRHCCPLFPVILKAIENLARETLLSCATVVATAIFYLRYFPVIQDRYVGPGPPWLHSPSWPHCDENVRVGNRARLFRNPRQPAAARYKVNQILVIAIIWSWAPMGLNLVC